jgi:hypothetical protein
MMHAYIEVYMMQTLLEKLLYFLSIRRSTKLKFWATLYALGVVSNILSESEGFDFAFHVR